MVDKVEHHVVPQFYLRRFASADREIWATDLATNTSKLVPVKQATVISGFYLFEDTSGQPDQGWEDILGRLESNAARAIRRVVDESHWPLPAEPRKRLAEWIAAQYLRTPKMRAYLDKSLDEWRESVDRGGPAAIRVATQQPHLTDAEALELWKHGDDVIPRRQPQHTGAYLRAFSDLLRGAVENFYQRRWQLVKFDGPTLMTADELVVPIADGPDPHPLATGADLIAIPLSRDTLLNLLELDPKGERPDLGVIGNAEGAAMFNRMTVDNAHATVFRHPDDSPMVAVEVTRE